MTDLNSQMAVNVAIPKRKQRWQKGSLRQRGQMWIAEWRVTMKTGRRARRSRTIGTVDELSEAEARAIAEKLSQADATGICPDVPRNFAADLALNTRKPGWTAVGAIAELAVCADLLARGMEVYRTVNPLAKIDLICLAGEQCFRVEVKCADTKKNNLPACKLTTKRGHFDVLAVFSKAGEIRYFGADGKTQILTDGGFCRQLQGQSTSNQLKTNEVEN